ncbi:MAG: hypothetical protein OXH52_13555 [Gammaproteobacteria bacterium]|nr:hypothetical protein [Gammaproteobacteria bacterium]
MQGRARIAQAVADQGLDGSQAAARIRELANAHHVHKGRLDRALADAWAACVKTQLATGGLTLAEETRLDAILARFDKSRQDVDRHGLWKQARDAREKSALRQIADSLAGAMHPRGSEDEAEGAGALAKAEKAIDSAALEGGLSSKQVRGVLVQCVEQEIDRALEDGLLASVEEHAITNVTSHFGIGEAELDQNGARTRMIKAAVLRDLTEGVVPQRPEPGVRLPFRLQKSETLIWVFQNVEYSTIRTRREFQGRSAGASVRVAKGVYFRTGAFKGWPVETEERVHLDTGLLGVTTRHIYFAGASQRFRIRHDRIVTIEPYSNGVGIMRDNMRAKPETFGIGDGWFAYNLLSNVDAG